LVLETKKVLVIVKAYPNVSTKYKETVCVAGIDLDVGAWIRLYPVPYRFLDDEKRFNKYNIIEVKAYKAKDDHRPESFKVDADSIKIVDFIDTKGNWARRKELLLPTVSHSFCHILRASASEDISLGMFKPKEVDFIYRRRKPKQPEEKRQSCYAQQSLYNKVLDAIEVIPFDFRYSFSCIAPDCPGHELPIIDWELGQSYRSWRHKYRDENVLLEKLKQKWLSGMCSANHDTYFIVGNMQRLRENFMVLGVFYPKIITQ
jgi:hypothetical protein